MTVLPNPKGQAPRIATIHTDRRGQRVLHAHNLNTASKCLDTFDLGSPRTISSAFASSAAITLFDAESSLIIPVQSAVADGLVVIGSECAVFFNLPCSETRSDRRMSLSSGTVTSNMNIDEAEEDRQRASPAGKGKAREIEPSSPTKMDIASGPSASTRGQSGSSATRRRSSASQSALPQLATSPPSLIADPRSGNKRKLSEGANSSGRGKATSVTRQRQASISSSAPIEARLPISEYTA